MKYSPLLLIFVSAVCNAQSYPNYYHAAPALNPDAVVLCQKATRSLLDYQSMVDGIVTRLEVDRPNGYIEFSDSVHIRNEIYRVANYYENQIRWMAVNTNGEDCMSEAQAGKNEIDEIGRKVFGPPR